MSKGIPSATTLRYHAPLPRSAPKGLQQAPPPRWTNICADPVPHPRLLSMHVKNVQAENAHNGSGAIYIYTHTHIYIYIFIYIYILCRFLQVKIPCCLAGYEWIFPRFHSGCCQVVSSAFEGVSKIQRQRQVQEMRCLFFFVVVFCWILIYFDEVYFWIPPLEYEYDHAK